MSNVVAVPAHEMVQIIKGFLARREEYIEGRKREEIHALMYPKAPPAPAGFLGWMRRVLRIPPPPAPEPLSYAQAVRNLHLPKATAYGVLPSWWVIIEAVDPELAMQAALLFSGAAGLVAAGVEEQTMDVNPELLDALKNQYKEGLTNAASD